MKSLFLKLFRAVGFCGVSQLIASRMLQTASKAFRTLTEKMRMIGEEGQTLNECCDKLRNDIRTFPEEMPRIYARSDSLCRLLRVHHQEAVTAQKRARFIVRFLEMTLTTGQWKKLDCTGLESKLAENEEVHRVFYEKSRLLERNLAELKEAHNAASATAAIRQSAREKAPFNWPRLWELLSFLLPRKTRERVFEPCRNELLEDFQRAKKYKGKWETRWLWFCFTLRTALLVLDCWRAVVAEKALSLALKGVPEAVKRWWLG